MADDADLVQTLIQVLRRIEADAEGVQRGGVQFDSNGGLRAAAHSDLSDTLNLGEFLGQDGIGRIVHPADFVASRRERQDHHRRVSGIHLAVSGIRRQIRRQLPAGSVDGGLNLATGRVNVFAEIELERDIR